MSDDVVAKARKLREQHNVRTLLRPSAAGADFELSYLRTRPSQASSTVVVVPGGPGLASVLPYTLLHGWARRSQVDVLMVEHRGVGLSRRTVEGEDLTPEDMWLELVIEDLAQVLEFEKIDKPVLYGSSYGSYLVQAFAARYPDRVGGLVLDSAMLSTDDHVFVRQRARAALWEGPGNVLAAKLRDLIGRGLVQQREAEAVARIVYEFCGPEQLEKLMEQVHRGQGSFAWRRITALSDNDTRRIHPFMMEFDLVGTLAFRELNFAPEPDGGPFDPGVDFAEDAQRFPQFEGEFLDLATALVNHDFPVVVLSGERDLRTPRVVAESIVQRAANGHLVRIPNAGHSLLDTNQKAARAVLETISTRGVDAVPQLEAQVASIVRKPPLVSLASYVKVLMAISRVVPAR